MTMYIMYTYNSYINIACVAYINLDVLLCSTWQSDLSILIEYIVVVMTTLCSCFGSRF